MTNMTYVTTEEGWLYLAGIKDVFTCELAGYAMDERMRQTLTATVLWKAVRNRRPAPDLCTTPTLAANTVRITIKNW